MGTLIGYAIDTHASFWCYVVVIQATCARRISRSTICVCPHERCLLSSPVCDIRAICICVWYIDLISPDRKRPSPAEAKQRHDRKHQTAEQNRAQLASGLLDKLRARRSVQQFHVHYMCIGYIHCSVYSPTTTQLQTPAVEMCLRAMLSAYNFFNHGFLDTSKICSA